jgi:hypothetical protein
LSSDTWNLVGDHILPSSHQEIDVFYGHLWKYFARVKRFQVVVQDEGQGCEVILAHSLVCRKTNKEFIIDHPNLAFIQRLIDHVADQESEGSLFPCIFCTAKFPREELRLHLSEYSEALVTVLRYSFCFYFEKSSLCC